ncbi:MAG: protease complex subunit PrcB family protein [Eubacteriales bacterium]|nr:protease complex subunit PrcB family protein [Eubacteriales bacterium]
MKRLWKIICLGVALLTVSLLAGGCGEKEPEGKIRDLEFTVIEEDAVPKALKDVIEENRQKEMKLSYQNAGYLYIARGFGEQTTGGYSIAVEQCYLAEDGIHVKFQLLGPPHDEKIKEEPSYPYIVIKTEGMDETIVFE